MKHVKLSLAVGLLLFGSASAQVGKKSSGTSLDSLRKQLSHE
jgi:hypothetical protein